jgi:hypothetical protein
LASPQAPRYSKLAVSHAYAIEDMEQPAAQRLLAELMDAATAPGLSYVHTWRKGDVVMWDNRATMHCGRPWPAHEARLMVRTTISATGADGLEAVRSPSRQAVQKEAPPKRHGRPRPLRARLERPCCRRTAEQRHEFPPSHAGHGGPPSTDYRRVSLPHSGRRVLWPGLKIVS